MQSEKHRKSLIQSHQKLSPRQDYHAHKVSFINTMRNESQEDPLESLEHVNERMNEGW